ncbi:MAG: M48 family metallopeptidase [Clostridia bacterium]|nr:M48 family metallopeptidase [Clostridia bacterium]
MFEYKVIYSDRRTITLTFDKDGELLLRAPIGTKKKRLDAIVLEHASWIEKHRERTIMRAETEAALTSERVAALKSEARTRLLPLTKHYAALLGVSYGRITITSAKTRFGSCSSKGNIAYSYRLMLYPPEAQEYVVVHELCHRFYMNHSAAFYKKIESVLPDYKMRRALLKRIPKE